MNSQDVAFYGLNLIAVFLVAYRVRQILAERREERERFDADIARVRRDVVDDAWPLLSEGPTWTLADSQTPTHDALALERLRAGLRDWGRE